MDWELLQGWLDLPPGPWPPDDRTLLGVGDNPASPGEVEAKAVSLMARLRPHQLMHPELVTEGMNRLAQAMLALGRADPGTARVLGEPEASARGVQTIGFAPAAPPPPVPALRALTLPPRQVPAPALRALTLPPRQAPPLLLEPEPPPVPQAIALPEVEVPTLPAGLGAAGRRQLYAELAALRALTRAWAALRPAFADPSHAAATPAEVRDLLAGLAEFRAALAHPGTRRGEYVGAAPLMFAVAGSAQGLALWRSLTYSQRQSLARDWAIGQATWQANALAVRRGLRSRRPGPSVARQLRWLGERLARVPESAPVLLGGAVLAVGVWRALPR